MKIKLQAGVEMDMLSRDELHEELGKFRTAWQQDAAKGDRYRRFYAYGTPAGGAVDFGGDLPEGDALGPAQGFVWAVKRVAIVGLADGETALLSINSVESSTTIHPALSGYLPLDANQVVLYPGDKLRVSATTAATERVFITGQARELPISLAWRL